VLVGVCGDVVDGVDVVDVAMIIDVAMIVASAAVAWAIFFSLSLFCNPGCCPNRCATLA